MLREDSKETDIAANIKREARNATPTVPVATVASNEGTIVLGLLHNQGTAKLLVKFKIYR